VRGQTRVEEKKDNDVETREVPRLDGAGKRMVEKVVIQGLASPESRTCDGNLSRTPDPV
jgi:hypothetical protein